MHALSRQFLHTFHEFLMRGGTETADADVAHLGTNHINGIDALHGNLVALHGEIEHFLHTPAHDAEFYLRSARPAQPLHNLLFRHLHTGNGSVVDGYDTVACHNTHLLGRTIGGGLDDEQRIFHHIKLNADAVEIALQRFVHGLHLLGIGIGGMGIEFLEHAFDGILHEFLLVDGIHIEIIDCHFRNLELAQGGAAAEIDAELRP